MIFIRSLIFNVAFILWTAVIAILASPIVLFSQPAVFWVARKWGEGILFLCRHLIDIDFELRGKEFIPVEGAVIVSQHQSFWDTIIFLVVVNRAAYVYKKELDRIPFFNLFLRATGGICIDRSQGLQALKTLIKTAKKRAQENQKIIIFAQGTRTGVRELVPIQPGVVALYQTLDVPFIPVLLNSGAFWGRRAFYKKPGKIILEFMPPLPKKLSKESCIQTIEKLFYEQAPLRLN